MAESSKNIIERNTFRKTERLSSRKEIERLFAEGASVTVHPLKLVFVTRVHLPELPAQTMFVVPKRNFRKAHDRNLLRRRMRECFRIQKKELYAGLADKNKRVSMAILFTGRKEESYDTITRAMRELLSKFSTRI